MYEGKGPISMKKIQGPVQRSRGGSRPQRGKNEVEKLHKSQQDFTRMEFAARQCGDRKGLYVTQELLTGIKVRFLTWKAKVNNTNPVSKRTELSPSHRMSRERYLATAN